MRAGRASAVCRHQHRWWTASVLLAAWTSAMAGCGGGSEAPTTTRPSSTATAVPGAIGVVSGGEQSGDAGSSLATPLIVRVTTTGGAPVPNVPVNFQVTSGSATVSVGTATTDATGQAQTQLVLGSVAGPVRVTASVAGTALAASFTATVAATAASCDPATATTLTPGAALTPTGTQLCVGGAAAGGEYALVAFNGATAARTRSAFVVHPTGTDPVSPSTLLPGGVGSPAAAQRALADVRLGDGGLAQPAYATPFERQLREVAARTLRPRIAAARAWRRAGAAAADVDLGPRRAAIPRNVTVGTLVTLNANGDDPCERPQYRGARVQAISNRAIVVADTSNPTNGFTAAEYQSIAVTFDTLVDAVDRRNFGDPSDLDGNGRVVLYYTSAVNALTPRNSDFYVGGFFTPRDLFPTRDGPLGKGCAASNEAELFYLLVPDPSGMVNGNRQSKSFVAAVTIATVAHEYEHLINASRRLYVSTTAEDFEEPWLDEGLAHVAEELVFFQRAGLGPRRNIDATLLRSTPPLSAAFTEQAIENFDRLALFLENPQRNSPYADDDSLATRGAAWSFLRYAADRQSTADQTTIWSRLVNSSTSGLDNLRQVFGAEVTGLFRDWATTLLLDDVPGADARYQFASWNLRSVLAALDGSGVYPLRTTALTSGSTNTSSIVGGGAAYLRFAVGAGRTASLSWEALPPTVTLTLVRLR